MMPALKRVYKEFFPRIFPMINPVGSEGWAKVVGGHCAG
jgi:hypothetical protein